MHLHHFSKIKSKKSYKIVEIKVFLLVLYDDRRIQIREAQNHVNPVNPTSTKWASSSSSGSVDGAGAALCRAGGVSRRRWWAAGHRCLQLSEEGRRLGGVDELPR